MSATGSAIGNLGSTALVEMAMTYFRSRVLCAAARLGIADALASGTTEIQELASVCGADPDSLYRLMRTLASLGIVVETAQGEFALTAFGEPLRKDVAGSVWASVVFWSDLLADSWSFLTDCIVTGNRAADVMEDRGIASRWSKDPNAGSIFRAVMGASPSEDYVPLVRSWDFTGHKLVADLGGGGGALIRAVLRSYPDLKGMLVDRQPALDSATSQFETQGLLNRCTMVAADLYAEVPAGADVYMIKHVLHGYPDDAALQILKNIRAIASPDSLLLVIEFVLPDLVSHADPGLEGRFMSDLNMLALTGGKERSIAEWKLLLARSGFELRRILPVSADKISISEVSILEASPAA